MKTTVVMVISCFLLFDLGLQSKLNDPFKFNLKKKKNTENLHAENRAHEEMDRKSTPSECIPDIIIQLVSGSNKHLQDFIDHKKYIYITFWPNKQALSIKDLRAYDSIAAIYKNKLQVIGLLDNGNVKQLNSLIKKYQLQNLTGVVAEKNMQQPLGKGYPYGMLFSKYGRLIHKEMSKEELERYMRKHVGVERAKF